MIRYRIAIAALSGLVLASAAEAHEKTIARSALPPAVEATVAKQLVHGQARGFAEEVENGKTFYEAELTVNGHSRDLLIDSQGIVVEIEEQVAFDHLPAKVRAGLKAMIGKGHVVRVESLTKHDVLVAYEATVTTKGKRSEIQVGPNGEKLDHEE
ncbi:MAG TPA: hypothetical protein VN783_08080 [Thermoanaerobaculia bacterium]|nr:hypothetical protein [Thermoanaerobaculia bacterium]